MTPTMFLSASRRVVVFPTSLSRCLATRTTDPPQRTRSFSSSRNAGGSSGGRTGGIGGVVRPILTFAVAGAFGYGAVHLANRNLDFASDDGDDAGAASDGPVPPSAEITCSAYFDVAINGYDAGRIVMGLYGNVVPVTTRNFAKLCEGTERSVAGRSLTYEGSGFHRVIPGFMIQGGDFTRHDGTGGLSIYGEKFRDENFRLKHTGPGCLSMANAGPNTNGSQFFITTSKTSHLDGRHVVFGVVEKGWDVVKLIESKGSRSGTPSAKIVIMKCGILAKEEGDRKGGGGGDS